MLNSRPNELCRMGSYILAVFFAVFVRAIAIILCKTHRCTGSVPRTDTRYIFHVDHDILELWRNREQTLSLRGWKRYLL